MSLEARTGREQRRKGGEVSGKNVREMHSEIMCTGERHRLREKER